MRIMFLYPSLISGWSSYRENGNNESSYMDHGVALLSAVLKRAGHETFCVDLRSFNGWEHFEQVIKQQTFDVTFVGFFSANERFARQAVEIIKRNFPDKYIVGGGVHLSVTQTREYPNIDSIVLGEGEPHILDIVDTIARGEAPQKVYDLKMVADLDTLPYVDRSLFNPRMEQSSPLLAQLPKPFITIVAGRGCWGKCTFCYPSRNLISGNKIRIRSVDHFMGEVIDLNRSLGRIGSLMIHDDLLGNEKWITEFIEKWNINLPYIPWWCQLRADTIIKMKKHFPELANTGLTYVSVGLESGSPRMLEFLQKGTTVEENIEACKILHDNGINIFGNYIVGLPTETDEDLEATGKMLAEIRPAFHSASTYTSYPGSSLYNWIKENDYWAKPEEHYSMTRFPYEQKIKGVDYEKIRKIGESWRNQYTSQLRTPKRLKRVSGTSKFMRGKPKASVIIITYNRPDLLRGAIQSILNQTLQDWELIVSDYTENFEVNKAVYEWASHDDRIQWILHSKNINNISFCWNEILDKIRGDYWCTLDDDNVKYPKYLEKMTEYLDSNKDKLAVVCPMEHSGSVAGTHYQKPSCFEDLRMGNKIDSGQVVYRKSIIETIGNFDERLVSLEDWDYMLRVYHLNNLSGTAFGWLDGESLCSYHWHPNKRMWDEGIKSTYNANIPAIRNKTLSDRMRVKYATPKGGLTFSQTEFYSQFLEALRSLNFVDIVDNHADVVILSGTLYNFTENDINQLKEENLGAQFVATLLEDPQALHANIKYTKFVDWMVTNDMNAYDFYIKNVDFPKKRQVLHWNNMSISNRLLDFIKTYSPKKEYDICFIGYPYPSRIKFMKELLPKIKNRSIVLIGDTWKEFVKSNNNITTFDTINDIETAKIAMKCRITLVKHRNQMDIGGFPVVGPISVNRGYIEAAYKNVLIIDSDRTEHAFDEDSVVKYTESDCAEIVNEIIDNYGKYNYHIIGLYNKAVEFFTFKTRITKILNCVRSQRFNVKID